MTEPRFSPGPAFDGITPEDFDPSDPHCWACNRHLHLDIPAVVMGDIHRITGERRVRIVCILCAYEDLTDREDSQARKDSLN